MNKKWQQHLDDYIKNKFDSIGHNENVRQKIEEGSQSILDDFVHIEVSFANDIVEHSLTK